MSQVDDVGGQSGFGPVAVEPDEPPFHTVGPDEQATVRPGAPSALDGFQNAVATALTLRDDTGLGFVVAPARSRDGEPVVGRDER